MKSVSLVSANVKTFEDLEDLDEMSFNYFCFLM